MKEFIARLGYTMCYAFDFPKKTFEEGFDVYFGVGMFGVVIFGLAILVGIILLSIYVKEHIKDARKP